MFRIVTYNILAQAYVKAERYPLSTEQDLDVASRQKLLLAQMPSFGAGILCLQEVENDFFETLVRELSDYAGEYEQRPGKPDGCATFVRHSFTVDQTERLHYQAHDDGGSQLALISRLQLGSHRLVVANTHLRWQPPRTDRQSHFGRLQLLELLELRTNDSDPWLIVGDLNALSESVVIQAAEERGFALSCRTQRPWDTTNIDGRRRKIDYLLYEPEHLRPTPGTLAALERDTPMPSPVHPSDHLPLQVDFSFR